MTIREPRRLAIGQRTSAAATRAAPGHSVGLVAGAAEEGSVGEVTVAAASEGGAAEVTGLTLRRRRLRARRCKPPCRISCRPHVA